MFQWIISATRYWNAIEYIVFHCRTVNVFFIHLIECRLKFKHYNEWNILMGLIFYKERFSTEKSIAVLFSVYIMPCIVYHWKYRTTLNIKYAEKRNSNKCKMTSAKWRLKVSAPSTESLSKMIEFQYTNTFLVSVLTICSDRQDFQY